MKTKKLLVTGATGYIGGTFSYEALKKGFEVVGIDNFSNSNKSTKQILDNFTDFTFYETDISKNPNKIYKIISENKPDVIIHFAGLKSVSESEQNQNLYWQNNMLSTLNILESIKNNNISLIFSSSAILLNNLVRCDSGIIRPLTSNRATYSSPVPNSPRNINVMINVIAISTDTICQNLTRFFKNCRSKKLSALRGIITYNSNKNC